MCLTICPYVNDKVTAHSKQNAVKLKKKLTKKQNKLFFYEKNPLSC